MFLHEKRKGEGNASVPRKDKGNLRNSYDERIEESLKEGNEYGGERANYRHSDEYKGLNQDLNQGESGRLRMLNKTTAMIKPRSHERQNNSDLEIKQHLTRKWVRELRNKITIPKIDRVSVRENEQKSVGKSIHVIKTRHLKANQSMIQEILNDMDEFDIKYAERLKARLYD